MRDDRRFTDISVDQRENCDANVLMASGGETHPAPAKQAGKDNPAADRQQRRVWKEQRRHQHTGAEKRVNQRVPVGFVVAGAPRTVVRTQHTVCPFLG